MCEVLCKMWSMRIPLNQNLLHKVNEKNTWIVEIKQFGFQKMLDHYDGRKLQVQQQLQMLSRKLPPATSSGPRPSTLAAAAAWAAWEWACWWSCRTCPALGCLYHIHWHLISLYLITISIIKIYLNFSFNSCFFATDVSRRRLRDLWYQRSSPVQGSLVSATSTSELLPHLEPSR